MASLQLVDQTNLSGLMNETYDKHMHQLIK